MTDEARLSSSHQQALILAAENAAFVPGLRFLPSQPHRHPLDSDAMCTTPSSRRQVGLEPDAGIYQTKAHFRLSQTVILLGAAPLATKVSRLPQRQAGPGR
jgi:hypothetical protein